MNIVPVTTGIPEKTINKIKIQVGLFDIDATICNLNYQLITDENIIISVGTYGLTEIEFANWGSENQPYLEDLVLNHLGLTRLIEE